MLPNGVVRIALICIFSVGGAWAYGQSCMQGCTDATCYKLPDWSCVNTSATACHSSAYSPVGGPQGMDCTEAPAFWPKTVVLSCESCDTDCGTMDVESASNCRNCNYMRSVPETGCGDVIFT